MMRLLGILIVATMAVGCAQTAKTTTNAKDAKATATPADKAAGKKAATTSAGAIECKSGSDVRSLEVKTASAGGYEVVYTKFGEAKSIATGGRDHCEAIKERVKGNLANAGYTCS